MRSSTRHRPAPTAGPVARPRRSTQPEMLVSQGPIPRARCGRRRSVSGAEVTPSASAPRESGHGGKWCRSRSLPAPLRCVALRTVHGHRETEREQQRNKADERRLNDTERFLQPGPAPRQRATTQIPRPVAPKMIAATTRARVRLENRVSTIGILRCDRKQTSNVFGSRLARLISSVHPWRAAHS